jgi:hypothetical protein
LSSQEEPSASSPIQHPLKRKRDGDSSSLLVTECQHLLITPGGQSVRSALQYTSLLLKFAEGIIEETINVETSSRG